MVLTVQNIIDDAFGLCNIIAPGEGATAAEYTQAIRTANVMIDRWASQRLLLRSSTGINLTLTANKSAYTIGPVGADFISPKPLTIQSAYYTDSGGTDYPVEVIPIEQYNNLTDKSQSSGPVLYLTYDPGSAQQTTNVGTIQTYYTPDQAYALHLEADLYLTEFVNLSDTVTFEPAYYEALIYNLGVRLFRYYRDANIQVPTDMMMIAQNSINNLKTLNSQTVIAGMDIPGKVSSYNIYSDATV